MFQRIKFACSFRKLLQSCLKRLDKKYFYILDAHASLMDTENQDIEKIAQHLTNITQ